MTDNLDLTLMVEKYKALFLSFVKENMKEATWSEPTSAEAEDFCLQRAFSTFSQRLDKIQYMAGKARQIPGGIDIMF